MTYKFIGRIKKIGINGCDRFCSFDVDNSIQILDKEYGVAYNNDNPADIKIIRIPEIFNQIRLCKYHVLLSAINERFEVEYECNQENKVKITKVTVLK